MSLIVALRLWDFNRCCFKVCSNDLALEVSRFCTDVSASDNLLVPIGILCTHSVSEDSCTRLCDS